MIKIKDGYFDVLTVNSTHTFCYIIDGHVVTVPVEEDDISTTDLVYMVRKAPDCIANYPKAICTYEFSATGEESTDVTGTYKQVVKELEAYEKLHGECMATLKNGPKATELYEKHFK